MCKSCREDRYLHSNCRSIPSWTSTHSVRASPGLRETTCLSWAGAHYYTCIVDSLVTTAPTIPRHVVHENSNNISETRRSRGCPIAGPSEAPIPVHATTPSETESPCQKTQAVMP